MTLELITFKLEKSFLEEVDSVSKHAGFHNRTEFIRNALRDKMDEIRTKKALLELKKNYGSGKRFRTSDADLSRIREEVGKELKKEFGIK